MFSRNKGVMDRFARAKDSLRNRGSDAVDVLDTKAPNKVDRITAAALVLGVANWISMSVFNLDVVQAVAKRKSVPGRAAYGFLGVSALWAAMRGARR